jgi:electron transport complex protein RnfD
MSTGVMFPHIFRRHTTHSIMLCVAIALLPIMGWIVALYGEAVLISLQYFLLWCLVWELMANAVVRRFTLSNGSGLVPALILTLSFPPHLSMVMVAQISFVAIILGKWIFGGLGFNLVNPAMLGRSYAWLAWPEIFENNLAINLDNSVVKVVMDVFKVKVQTPDAPVFWGGHMDPLANVSLALLLLGALWLLAVHVLPWLVSLTYLVSFILMMGVLQREMPTLPFIMGQIGWPSIVFVAFFMATDMAMLPGTWRGRGIYGFVMGMLTAVLMMTMRHEVAVMTGLLIVNLMAPFIADITMSEPFSLSSKELRKTLKEERYVLT